MGKRAELSIKESLSKLKSLKKQPITIGKKQRVYAFICLKESKFDTRKQLANHLGVHVRSIEKWVRQYKEYGIDDLLVSKPRRKGSKIITAKVHQYLEERVNNPKTPFKGYWDAQQCVKQQHGLEVSYHWLRQYMINHFKTKVKRPRKSHVEKDPNSEEAFFKTTQYLQ